jgi:hypothetical protein
MTEKKSEFDQLMRVWTSERIAAPGPDAYHHDREYMVERRADELTALARQRGLFDHLYDAAEPHGGIRGMVRDLHQAAETAQLRLAANDGRERGRAPRPKRR